ncbi:MAG TPA: hypothetical protein VGN77_01035, partial [Steroidobacteraceae bacterium]|nr:hypothetical protein [Steroidobacteraceae bacterium]
KCHCGNLSFSLNWEPDPATIPARTCGCAFCIKHGGIWTSHRDGLLKIVIREPAFLSMYEVGSKTAQFHICARCGVVPVVTSCIDGKMYAVVSVNAFEGVDRSLIRPSPADFEGEQQHDRLARRQRNWIANVEYVAAEGSR